MGGMTFANDGKHTNIWVERVILIGNKHACKCNLLYYMFCDEFSIVELWRMHIIFQLTLKLHNIECNYAK